MINQNPEQASRIYDFNEHKHRYAVWTVARAQRAFKKNTEIETALESVGLRQFVQDIPSAMTQDEFDKQHAVWCRELTKHFLPDTCSFGRAAKMVAIYLKTALVIPLQGEGNICNIIHPPIDSILLAHLAKEIKALGKLKSEKWTQLELAAYRKIIKKIRKELGYCNWRTECYWKLTNKKEE